MPMFKVHPPYAYKNEWKYQCINCYYYPIGIINITLIKCIPSLSNQNGNKHMKYSEHQPLMFHVMTISSMQAITSYVFES